MQTFELLQVLPKAASVGVASAVPFVMGATKGLLDEYGVVGELVRLGAIGILMVLSM